MPIYEFACRDCDHRFEELVRAAAVEADCPQCGSARTARLMSAFSVRSISGANGLARAMSRAGAGAGGGCCGGSCGCH